MPAPRAAEAWPVSTLGLDEELARMSEIIDVIDVIGPTGWCCSTFTYPSG
jgi:hypothetical protein